MDYMTDYDCSDRKDLDGLYLIQINPDLAVDLRCNSENRDWIFNKDTENHWQKYRKAQGFELDEIWDMVSDHAVVDASPDAMPSKRKNKYA